MAATTNLLKNGIALSKLTGNHSSLDSVDLWSIHLRQLAVELNVDPIVTATALQFFRLKHDVPEATIDVPEAVTNYEADVSSRVQGETYLMSLNQFTHQIN